MLRTNSNEIFSKQDFRGAFHSLSYEDQQLVHLNGGMFYYRNGVVNSDGSMGQVALTPQELRDLIAHLLLAVGAITIPTGKVETIE